MMLDALGCVWIDLIVRNLLSLARGESVGGLYEDGLFAKLLNKEFSSNQP